MFSIIINVQVLACYSASQVPGGTTPLKSWRSCVKIEPFNALEDNCNEKYQNYNTD